MIHKIIVFSKVVSKSFEKHWQWLIAEYKNDLVENVFEQLENNGISDFHDGSSTGGHARWETKQSTAFYPGKFHHSLLRSRLTKSQWEALFISILQSLQRFIVQSSISNRTLHYHGFSTWFNFEYSFLFHWTLFR